MNKRNTTKPKNEVAQQTEQETDQQQETPQEEAQQTEQEIGQETGQETEQETGQETEQETGQEAQKEEAQETETYKEGSRVGQLLRLYPKYKRAYVSKKGFVYPEGTPEWQRGDAVLYENKYFTK